MWLADKTKASNLVKTLVCLQALWFCVQYIVRFAQGLPVSSLALSVFGHAICALLMYLLWLDKPLDIGEPTVLSGNMARELCALMYMRSFPSATRDGDIGPTELPYGVRYGSKRSRNIAETSARPHETKWHGQLGKELGSVNTWHDIMVLYGLKPPEEFIPSILECRLHWASTGSVDAQSKSFCQYTAYLVDLDYPGDAVGPKDRTTSPALPLGPAVVADNGLHVPNAGTRSIQPLPPSPSITNNRIGIDGFYLTLGKWPKQGLRDRKSIIKAVFVSRQPQPDYAPASVTVSHADAVRWRLYARALQ
jgi:hypothetical protein